MANMLETLPGHRYAPGFAPDGDSPLVEVVQWFDGALATATPMIALLALTFLWVSRSMRSRRLARERNLDEVLEADARFEAELARSAQVRATRSIGTNPRLGREGGYWGDGEKT